MYYKSSFPEVNVRIYSFINNLDINETNYVEITCQKRYSQFNLRRKLHILLMFYGHSTCGFSVTSGAQVESSRLF